MTRDVVQSRRRTDPESVVIPSLDGITAFDAAQVHDGSWRCDPLFDAHQQVCAAAQRL